MQISEILDGSKRQFISLEVVPPLKSISRAELLDRELPLEEAMEFFDWRMFFATWGVKYDAKLQEEATGLLEHLQATDALSIRVAAKFYDAVREGDDAVLDGGRRIPMMRQAEGKGLSLVDFISGKGSPLGVFAASVHTRTAHCSCQQCCEVYEPMLLRSVKVTLAEAVSNWIDARLDGCLDKAGRSDARIIKPAAGYSSCPDHTLKRDIMELLPDSGKLGIEFTESYAMIPDASICGFILAHPQTCYPEIRRVSRETLRDYASRRGMSDTECRTFLGHLCQDD